MGSVANKYRVHEVAKDFGVATKDITEILTKYAETPKNHMQVLEDRELSLIFEYLTQHNQIASIATVFAEGAKAEEKKPEPKKQPQQNDKPQAQKQGNPQPKNNQPNANNNSNSSNTTASPASTASTVLQTGDCQQVRRTGRFLQGGGGGQDEQRFGCIAIMPLSHRWNS